MPRIKMHELHDESPILRARRLAAAPLGQGFSHISREHLRRISTKIPLSFVEILDREEVAFRVCRWIAWGRWLQDRALRMGLAMLLRYEANPSAPGRRSTSGWAWPEEPVLTAAEKNFRKSEHFKHLVRAGVFVDNKTPTNVALITSSWPSVWTAITNEMRTVDLSAFVAQAKQLAATRKRRRASKRVKLRPEEVQYLEALATLRKGVLRGDISVAELQDLHKS